MLHKVVRKQFTGEIAVSNFFRMLYTKNY